MNREKICVYTCLIGGYERLNEQPVAKQSNIPFFCLTDDPRLTSATWRIARVDPLFPMDPIRSQRLLKILPHRFLPDYDASLYIDNTVSLTRPAEEILDRYFQSVDFALPTHSYRDILLNEFISVADALLDEPARVFEQLNHLALTKPGVLLQRPFWTGVLMRRHRSQTVSRMLDHWAVLVQRYSRRDQLSVNVAFADAGLDPHRIEIDTFKSWFHSWPHKIDRNDASSLRRPGGSLVEVISRLGTADGMFKTLLEQVVAVQSGLEQSSNNVDRVRTPNGRTIYVDGSDERAKHLMRTGGDLYPPTLAMWRLLLDECAWTHIVDVGANYGELLVNVDFPPSAAVIALEPNPHVLKHLRRTLSELNRHVTVLDQAASAMRGSASLIIDRAWSGMTKVEVDQTAAGIRDNVIKVPTTTLSTIVPPADDGTRPSVLVKIDVEGHELSVLEGARELVERADRFVALAEILHSDDRSLEWLLARFAIELYDPQQNKLKRSNATNATGLRNEIAANRYSPQDAVLRPRSEFGGTL